MYLQVSQAEKFFKAVLLQFQMLVVTDIPKNTIIVRYVLSNLHQQQTSLSKTKFTVLVRHYIDRSYFICKTYFIYNKFITPHVTHQIFLSH